MINSLPQVEKINVAVFYADGIDAATSCCGFEFKGYSGGSIPVYSIPGTVYLSTDFCICQ